MTLRLEIHVDGRWLDADRHRPHVYADRAELELEAARRQAEYPSRRYRTVTG